jgi:DNA-directed RNA polymerase subunit K
LINETFTFSRYERARIIGARSLQISMGAPVLIEGTEIDPLKIATEELKSGIIPITVKRDIAQ